VLFLAHPGDGCDGQNPHSLAGFYEWAVLRSVRFLLRVKEN
jgi:hypothetical protein